MCGLFGLLKFESHKNADDWLKDVCYLSALRGTDSTGMAFVPKDDKDSPVIIKATIPSYHFIETKAFTNAMKALWETSVVIGHTRLATRGSINYDTSHPFTYGHITLAHNGTLRNCINLEGDHTDIDSQRIAMTIAKHGWEHALPLLEGAYALTWFDKNNNTLNMARNDERTLYFAKSKTDKQLLWASEAWMISVAAQRRGIEIGKTGLLKPGTTISWDLSVEEVSKYASNKFVVHEPPKVVHHSYSGSGYMYNPVPINPQRALPQNKSAPKITVGSKVNVLAWEWLPYTKASVEQPTGFLEGVTIPDEASHYCTDKVMIHNVPEEIWTQQILKIPHEADDELILMECEVTGIGQLNGEPTLFARIKSFPENSATHNWCIDCSTNRKTGEELIDVYEFEYIPARGEDDFDDIEEGSFVPSKCYFCGVVMADTEQCTTLSGKPICDSCDLQCEELWMHA